MMSHSLTQQQRRRDWNFWSSQKNKTIESFQIWQEYDVADDTKKIVRKKMFQSQKQKQNKKDCVFFAHEQGLVRVWSINSCKNACGLK
jgi:hypothetical protein